MASAQEKSAAKREELLKALAELGITNSTGTETIPSIGGDEDNKTLAELLKKAKDEAKSAAKREEPTTAVGVYNGNQLVRVYSQEMHGDEYESLAEQYISKYSTDAASLSVRPYTPPAPALAPREETEFVNVLTPSGDIHRVYSLTVHGEDYRTMAEEFVAKYAERKYTLSS